MPDRVPEQPSDGEVLEYSRPPGLPGVDVLRAEHSSRCWKVYHETYAVATVLDSGPAGAEWMYRRRIHFAATGGLMLIEPGEVHENTRVLAPGCFRVLLASPDVVARAAKELELRSPTPHLRAAQVYDRELFRVFARLHACLEHDATSLEPQSRFATCLRLLLERCAETAPPAPAPFDRTALRWVRDFIRDDYARTIMLADLAAVSGLSRFHLVRAFTEEFGLPPHAYQVQVRVERARVRLDAGMPIAAAASAVGFADQSHFTRHFKRVFGVTPGRYVRGAEPAGQAPGREGVSTGLLPVSEGGGVPAHG